MLLCLSMRIKKMCIEQQQQHRRRCQHRRQLSRFLRILLLLLQLQLVRCWRLRLLLVHVVGQLGSGNKKRSIGVRESVNGSIKVRYGVVLRSAVMFHSTFENYVGGYKLATSEQVSYLVLSFFLFLCRICFALHYDNCMHCNYHYHNTDHMHIYTIPISSYALCYDDDDATMILQWWTISRWIAILPALH